MDSGAEVNGNGARFVGAFLAGLAAGTAAAVQNDGFRGRHLPSSYGRDAREAYARVSFKPERAFNVIAHVRDWEHAETVRRRCLRTVRGFVLQVECTGQGDMNQRRSHWLNVGERAV